MIRAAPVIDFVGLVQVGSLEVGTIQLNTTSTPAVKILLQQNQSVYPILASNHLAGEVYAYCTAAHEQGIPEINIRTSCSLVMDIEQKIYVIASSVTWFTSSTLRRQASAKITQVVPQRNADAHFTCWTEPFASFQTGMEIVR